MVPVGVVEGSAGKYHAHLASPLAFVTPPRKINIIYKFSTPVSSQNRTGKKDKKDIPGSYIVPDVSSGWKSNQPIRKFSPNLEEKKLGLVSGVLVQW